MSKYRQSRRDREDESRGMERYERRRRRDERDERGGYRRVDGEDRMGMIKEDHNEVANLPRREVMRSYPSWRSLNGAYLDDSIRGIDDLNDENERRLSDSMRRDRY